MKEKCFLTWKKEEEEERKKKNITSNPPPFPPPSQKPTHTQKKIKARPPRCISGFIMGNNQKCRSKTVKDILFFPVLIWITKKKILYFTIFGWDYSRILHSSLHSLRDHNGGHGWKNRTNGEARLYKLLTKIRKSSTSLQFRLGWKTLEKKPPKHITAAAAETDHRVSSLVASAALRKSSL